MTIIGRGQGFLPTQLNGCAIWLRGDRGITLATGVSVWADQSGNAFNGTQGTGALQPLYTTSAINGLPGLKFSAANGSILNFGSPNTVLNGTSAERYFVMQAAADAPSDVMSDNGNWGTSGNATHIPFTDGNVYDCFARTTRPAWAKSNDFSKPTIYSAESSGTGGTGLWQARVNGTIQPNSVSNTNTYAPLPFAATLTVGSTDYTLCEYICFNRVLGPNERKAVTGYLGARYGIQVRP